MTDVTQVDPVGTDLAPVAGRGALVSAPNAHVQTEPRQYVMIGLVLVVITAFEVATAYLEGSVNPNLIIAALGVMAALKIFLVVAWFMHLRTDSKILRRLFLLGVCAAPIVYTIMLLMLHVFRY